ncbi:DUF6088 family protein [Formosa sp. A9]|uniref:DUF6088 family protein n=1 Tax=Formosa sp. A9 TaxID=3442641 RepID=UPI003EC0666D
MPNFKIEHKISKATRGRLFFSEDFTGYASQDAIRQSLSRLEKDGVLTRLAQGIYLKPQIDDLLGVIYPKIEDVAKQIAKRDKARIAPTGVYALYTLGLTTQIPLKITYLTDGSQRDIKIGKSVIKFKKTVPRTFAIKDELLQLIVQACKEIGQKNITETFIKQLQPKVQQLHKNIVAKELKFAPVWIQKLIQELYNDSNYVD